jgi:hypothetical protein
MNTSLEIAKKNFKIWRHFAADILIFSVCFLCYAVLPLYVPMAGYFWLIHDSTEKLAEFLMIFVFLYFVFLLSFLVPCFLDVISDKMRLPIRMTLDNNFFVLMDKNGKPWKIRYANCRYTDSFVRCIFGSLFRGTWSRGITIYIPKEHLARFPRGFSDTTNDPPNMSFHFPMNTEAKSEIISFLENKNCRRVPPIFLKNWLIGTLIALFAPALFLWIHAAAIFFLYEQVGDYGAVGLFLIGLTSGVVVALSTIIKPYSKIEYLRRKKHIKIKIYVVIALSIGCPIYFWITQNEMQPNVFTAVFITLLCYVESYLWTYCLLRQERRSTG